MVEVFAIIVTIMLAFFTDPLKENSVIFFGSYILIIGILVALDYVMEKFRQIDENTKKISKLEEVLDIRVSMENLKERISKIEGFLKSRKGQIDPRWILIGLILILLYFYLKSQGYNLP